MDAAAMGRILTTVLAVIGGMAVLAGAAYVAASRWRRRIPRRTILEADFERGLIEYVPDDPMARMTLSRSQVVRDVVEALERAETDERVIGLVARVGSAAMGLAQIQEVRDAVASFRARGKRTAAFAETLGEQGPGNGAYYLATAFGEIYLQPSGDVGLTGLVSRSPFLRGALDKLGIVPRIDHRREYKSFKNLLTERKYTEPHREADKRVIESRFGQIVRGIAEARRLSESGVRALADRGPLSAAEAREAGLVDGLAYRDEVREKFGKEAGKEAAFLTLSEYLARAGRPHRRGETIALITGVGAIRRGRSRFNPVSGSFILGPDTVSSAFRAAVRDNKVRAILFRVDSRGGSYVASDTIWRETVRAREAGKPVVVSMGNVAGSGGYFIAMAADRIVAQPATLTGSIGVVGGKLYAERFWEKLGVSWDDVRTGPNATLWGWTWDYTPGQWDRLGAMLDRIYEDFTSRAARSRKMPLEALREAAKGRVWTGEDAKALGLVDALGGFREALRLAREAAGIAPEGPIRLKVFTGRRPRWRRLLGRARERGAGTAAMLTEFLEAVRPLIRAAGEVGIAVPSGILTMTGVDAGDE